MLDVLDFKTLVIAFTAVRLFQSIGLFYVWHFHRRYRPSADWAVGSALIAAGSLLIAFRDTLPLGLSAVGGNSVLLAGSMIFDLGVVRASGRALPTRAAFAVLAIAVLAFAWYGLVQPSLDARVAAFGVVVVLFDCYAAFAAWHSPRGPLRLIHRAVAGLLALEAGVTILRSVGFIHAGMTSVLQPSAVQTVFVLVGMFVAFTSALALAVLTSWVDAAKYKAAEVREIARSRAMRLIASGASLRSILEAIVEGVEAEHPEMLCSVLLLDHDDRTLRLGAAPRLPDFYNQAIHGLPIGPEVGACGTAAYFGRRVICADIATDPRWAPFRELAAAAGLGACWSEPIIDATGEVLGTFAIYHHGPHAPSDDDIATLNEAVQIAEFAIERSRAKQALNEQLLLTQQSLAKAERTGEMLDSALDNMSQGLAMFDSDQRLIVCNDKYLKLYDLPPELGAPGTALTEILKRRIANGYYSGPSPDDYLLSRAGFGKLPQITNKEALEHLNDGRTIRVTRRTIATGGWVTTHEDVTELRRNQARIAFMAHHDALTGLANRSHFKDKIEEARLRFAENGTPFAVLMLDLDRFKRINDSLGHGAGDLLLKAVASRLRAVAGTAGIVARLGGDEFAIVHAAPAPAAAGCAAAATHREGAAALAGRILDVFNEMFDLDGHRVSAGTSIGIALAPDDGTSFGELLKRADLALYAAKSKGRNSFCFFDAEMLAAADAHNRLEADLRLALERRQLELHYQPMVDVRSRHVVGVEALLRWRHPEQGLITPGQFIPIAEDTGLIIEIGEWVLNQACRDARGWPEHIKVAVNLSAVQFCRGDLFDVVKDALQTTGLPPSRLEVEVTESVLLDSEANYVAMLHRIKGIGVSVALDDFGTGYSSLSYLKQFPFDKIKIDRSFTADVTHQANSLAIVGAVIGLARGLDMITTAEGVETEEQFEIMRIAGVTFAQGYLFGRPCPKAELRFSGDASRPAIRNA